MDKEELYDLIERYLEGALPDAGRREVERRMATDAEFRAEVELHRAMQEHLGDPGELRLRATLEAVRKEPTAASDGPTLKARTGFGIWRRYWAAAAAILVLLVALFWWSWPSRPVIEQPVVENPPLPAPVPDKAPGSDEQRQQTTPIPDKEQRPIAMAAPADFVPNADLEDMMRSQLRSSAEEVALLSPDSGAVLKRRSDNTVAIQVHLRVSPGLLSEGLPFKLFIYSNKPQDWEKKQPLFSRDLPFVANKDTFLTEITFRLNLPLKPGLYYLVVRQQRREEINGDLYRTRRVGKFTVRN